MGPTPARPPEREVRGSGSPPGRKERVVRSLGADRGLGLESKIILKVQGLCGAQPQAGQVRPFWHIRFLSP